MARSARRRFMVKDEAILAERRGQLVDASTRVFTEHGYSNVSVAEIAADVGISVGAVYKYVPSKDYILKMVMDRVYSALESTITFELDVSASGSDRLVDLVRNVITSADEVIPGIRLMYREYGNLTRDAQKEFILREDRVLRFIQKIIETGNDSGEFNCKNPRLGALNILGTTQWWSLKRWAIRDIDLSQYIAGQSELILDMVGASRR
jgi:TetR/AcrR family transcriptional regulator, cholesterol catabolism regulator